MVLETAPVHATGAEVDDLLERAGAMVHRDQARAADLLDEAEERVAGHRDLVRSAQIASLRGTLELDNGNLSAATTAFRFARRSWLAAGRLVEACIAELGCTQVQLILGEFEAAEAGVLRVQAQTGWDTGGCEFLLARLNATVQGQLGDARAGVGEISEAMRHYDHAENLYRTFGASTGVAWVNLRRGIAAIELGMPHRALAELTRAHAGFRRAGSDRYAAYAAIYIADAQSMTGQIGRALELLERVRPELGDLRAYHALHDLSRAHVLVRAGLPAEAHAAARAAEEVFSDLGVLELSARAALACAVASLRLGKTDAADSELAAAERLFAECGSRLRRGWTWLGQARLALSVGDRTRARRLCGEILATDVDDVAPHLGVRARLVGARTGRLEDPPDLLDAAADLAGRTGMPELRMEVLLGRARHHRRAGDITSAIEELRRTLGVGHAWEHSAGDALDNPVRSALTEATDELIEVLLERNDHAGRVEAWQRVSAAKRATLVPLAERTRGWVPDPTEEERRQRLEELVHAPEEPLVGAPSRSMDQPLPAVPAISFVEYYVTGNDIVAFVGRDGHLEARRLTATASETRRLVNAWQQECWLMAAGPVGGLGRPSGSPALDHLFELLLAPLADLLADLEDDLQIVGHRHLHGVPFDAMLDHGAPWHVRLGLKAPAGAEETTGRSVPAALVLAVPDSNAPSIRAEAEMIFRRLPSAEILLGPEATPAQLAARAPEADVVHLACHGVFKSGNPLFSALRLGDGWLSARDILRGDLGLRGTVVVLSACSSGVASDHVSEPLGLAWACLAAGARSVIAALWAVDDDVTLDLMTQFYAGLAEGLDPHVALRRARHAIARSHPHPYYWAAFRCFTLPEGS